MLTLTGWRAPARPTMLAWIVVFFAFLAAMSACDGPGSAPKQPAESAPPASASRSWAGKEPAPAFPAGLTWFNVAQPPTAESLRGRVVLLDFWTLGCINCQHIVPDLKRLEEEFGPALVVIGVHSGKYSNEQDDESIRQAVRRLGLEHPVVNDPEFTFWDAYGANAWPTLVAIDPAGKLAAAHAGEGVYELFQPIIASLVSEFGAKGLLAGTPFPTDLAASPVSTILSFPGKVLADERSGSLFIADSGHNRILVAGLDGRLRMAIGSGEEGFADGGPREAMFDGPNGMALSTDGATLYVADTRNHAIRAVTLETGAVTTIAGTGKQLTRLPANGAPAVETDLASPWDVLIDGDRLFVAMAGVHQLWVIDVPARTVSVFAGTSREGIQDGPRRTIATLAQPSGLAADGTHLYWVDPESSAVRRTALAGDGDVETITGTGLFDWGDADGTGKAARLQHPQGIGYWGGHLFVADTYNHKVRSIDTATRAVTTVAGLGERGLADGPAALALLDEPGGLSVAGGLVYIADTNNHAIRVLDPAAGQITTLALSNLSVAGTTPGGRVTQVTLPAAEPAPGVSTLRVTVLTPAGHKLNGLAPSALVLTSGSLAVAELGENEVRWSSDAPEVTFPVPVRLAPGATTITATGAIYFCRSGEEALCLVQQIEITLPVTVSATAVAGEIEMRVQLAPAATP